MVTIIGIIGMTIGFIGTAISGCYLIILGKIIALDNPKAPLRRVLDDTLEMGLDITFKPTQVFRASVALIVFGIILQAL